MGKKRVQPVQLVSNATRWRMRGIFLCALVACSFLMLGLVSSYWQFGFVWIAPNPYGPGNMLYSESLDRGNWVSRELSVIAGWQTVETGFRVVQPGAAYWNNALVTPNGYSGTSSSTAVSFGVLFCMLTAFMLLLGIGKRANEIPVGSCGICEYDLRGVVSDTGVCPECGNPIQRTTPPSK